MNHSSTVNPSLQNAFWPENSLLKQALFILGGVILLALASQLSVPLRPIPLTFQSATVVLIGTTFGARHSAYVVSLYLLAGFCGIPVFEGFSAGPAAFFGPTCGYLIGFLPAAIISGYLAQKGFAKSILGSFFAACLGIIALFTIGVTVLAQSIGWQNAITFGVLPFIISEPIKLLALSCITPKAWKKQA